MIYIILNAICIAILLINFYKINVTYRGAGGHAPLFGGIFKTACILFIYPAIITILNILIMILRGECKHILFAFIPFMPLILVLIFQIVVLLQYGYTYKKYKDNDKICNATQFFLQSMGVNIEKSKYHTSYYEDLTYAKEAYGKEHCCVDVMIYDKDITDIQIYELVKETKKYLMSCFPKVYFKVEIHVDKD